ncbi:centrosomal protein of 89 kDa-like isoform X2 [Xenia sp. Carnegie-2017]|uniref:centrosomal protein of 89 kDa-like isoform X2 n=1 Tax=Xenia sp. Carnegie-2017 TaxID=2897299 RepID=UPI001F04E83E|nr:centrosomal protein of 89 kDa-like isoform X2 [Xenia sp. Carnegie-2017]
MSTRTENGVRQKRSPKHEAVDLGEENTTLNILKLLPSESADYSTHASNKLLQMQMEELKNENNILKDSVERLNFHVQLGSYQTTNAHNSFRDEVNMKYITPLLLAYDDQIKQKEAIIESYKEQFKKLKDKVQILVNENVQLREEKLNNSKRLFRDEDERKKLEEQAELVLTENDLLMKRHDIQRTS